LAPGNTCGICLDLSPWVAWWFNLSRRICYLLNYL
jgi:hypothetical protein